MQRAATPELMAIPDRRLRAFTACPELERYRRYLLDIRRRRAHVLSQPRCVAAAGEMAQAPDNIYGLLTDAIWSSDSRMARQQASAVPAPISPTGVPRRAAQGAFENLYQSTAAGNTIAAVLASQVKQLQFFAQARKYGSPWRLLSMSQTF
ncbi:MAG: hypothetical protein ACLTG4_02715 [Oscillospiraceae bacterium]